MDNPQRRSTDQPDHVERIVRIETNVEHVANVVGELKDALAEHVKDESHQFKGVADNYAQVAVDISRLADASVRTTKAIEQMADHSTRLHSLESFKERVEPLIEDTASKINKIWWSVPILWTVLIALAGGAWAIYKHISGGGP